DNENIHGSLNAMGLVYANAYLTIIVADGENANHGIRGISSDPNDIYIHRFSTIYSFISNDNDWIF
ncbi:uncharacterized protein K441DRAFT_587198, partial [Cenococcum geophilum 1.58]|uniref:uncharacterized protein n=1 Tax=Cenococcum geophilum 1.58 TaxID=794803 RepID=UPI00358E9907